jgi:hypothetical protein
MRKESSKTDRFAQNTFVNAAPKNGIAKDFALCQ